MKESNVEIGNTNTLNIRKVLLVSFILTFVLVAMMLIYHVYNEEPDEYSFNVLTMLPLTIFVHLETLSPLVPLLAARTSGSLFAGLFIIQNVMLFIIALALYKFSRKSTLPLFILKIVGVYFIIIWLCYLLSPKVTL